MNGEYLAEIDDGLVSLKKQLDVVERIIMLIKDTDTVFICGNGGSASIASHFASDLQMRGGQRAISLTDNLPTLTAWANDTDYTHIFSQQIYSLARKGDVLITLSGSGCSKNIIEACHAATALGLTTVAFVGYDGGVQKKHRGVLNIKELVHINATMLPCEAIFSVLTHYIASTLDGERVANNDLRTGTDNKCV